MEPKTGMTVKEIGEAVGWSYPTARSYMSRGDVRSVLDATPGRAPTYPMSAMFAIRLMARCRETRLIGPGQAAANLRLIKEWQAGRGDRAYNSIFEQYAKEIQESEQKSQSAKEEAIDLQAIRTRAAAAAAALAQMNADIQMLLAAVQRLESATVGKS